MPKTTVKGTVYDPGGKLPLYNVMVYVPNAPLDAIVEGVTCDKCGTIASGQPVASALTDASGNFTMTDVPSARTSRSSSRPGSGAGRSRCRW
jgi:hypothetical protein